MSEADEILQELRSVKKLLILALVKSGSTSEEIGEALGIDSSTVRKMFSIRKARQKKG